MATTPPWAKPLFLAPPATPSTIMRWLDEQPSPGKQAVYDENDDYDIYNQTAGQSSPVDTHSVVVPADHQIWLEYLLTGFQTPSGEQPAHDESSPLLTHSVRLTDQQVQFGIQLYNKPVQIPDTNGSDVCTCRQCELRKPVKFELFVRIIAKLKARFRRAPKELTPSKERLAQLEKARPETKEERKAKADYKYCPIAYNAATGQCCGFKSSAPKKEKASKKEKVSNKELPSEKEPAPKEEKHDGGDQ